MTDVPIHGEHQSGAVANVDVPTEPRLVQIKLNGVTLMVKKLVSVEELLRKARGASAILDSIEDYYIVTVKERADAKEHNEYHLGMSIEVSESERYLAVPKRLAKFV